VELQERQRARAAAANIVAAGRRAVRAHPAGLPPPGFAAPPVPPLPAAAPQPQRLVFQQGQTRLLRSEREACRRCPHLAQPMAAVRNKARLNGADAMQAAAQTRRQNAQLLLAPALAANRLPHALPVGAPTAAQARGMALHMRRWWNAEGLQALLQRFGPPPYALQVRSCGWAALQLLTRVTHSQLQTLDLTSTTTVRRLPGGPLTVVVRVPNPLGRTELDSTARRAAAASQAGAALSQAARGRRCATC